MLIQMFASGTNIQRLSKCARAVEGVLCSTYSELEQTETSGIVRRKFIATHITPSLQSKVDGYSPKERPSWVKIWDRPHLNKSFIESVVRGLTGYDSLNPHLNLSELTNTPITCIQMWTSANLEPMKQIERIARDAIPKWLVCKINGEVTTGSEAEEFIRQKIEQARREKKDGVFLLASIMTARSFSISEIQATVLAYERGSADTAAQKASRCLTPGTTYHYDDKLVVEKTEGIIIDVGMDPNRFENIEGIILEESIANITAENADNIHEAVRYTLASMNLFTVNEYGYLKSVSESDMFRIYDDTDNLLKIADINIDLNALFDDRLITILKNIKGGDSESQKTKDKIAEEVINTIVETTKKGKLKTETDKEKKDLKALVTRAVKILNMSATSVVFLAGDLSLNSYRECLASIMSDSAKSSEYHELFGVTPVEMGVVLDTGLLNEIILDLVVLASKPKSSLNLFNSRNVL